MSSDEFPKNQWDTLKQRMADGGPDAVLAFVAGHDALERRQLLSFAAGSFAWNEWPGKTLDGYLAIAQAAVREGLAQAETETDPEQRQKRVEFANVCSYNLSAKLADCWSDDTEPRTPAHFEAGLAAAEDCLRWRAELGKGPHPFSIAWWAKGMHEISLGRHDAAVDSLTKSLHFAGEAVRENGEEPSAAAHFGIALGEGYLAIAEQLAGRDGGAARFAAAEEGFAAMAGDAEKKGDADFGLEQIRTVAARYLGAAS